MSICDNPMGGLLFETALMNLSNGLVTPFDKQVLSYTPLPENFIAPYVSQVVQSRSAMELTYSSLTVWIEEAKKASYFSKHFVTLSKLINNGVVSMARGLATLHACGESLEKVPMSIQDLIMVSSYHIRKSYLGVLQTSAKQPEIGERLLMNQLSWTNTLLRLYKTKEKLDQPAAPLPEGIPVDDEKMLPTGENEKRLKASNDDGLKELPALSAPSRYTAVRAYGPNCKKSKASSQNGTAVESSAAAILPEPEQVISEIEKSTPEVESPSEASQPVEQGSDEWEKTESVQNEAHLDSFFAAAKPAQKNCTVLRHSSFEQKTDEDVLKRTTETAESSKPEAIKGSTQPNEQVKPEENKNTKPDTVHKEENPEMETADITEPGPETEQDDALFYADWDDLDGFAEAYLQTIPRMPDLFYEPIPIPVSKNKKMRMDQDTS